MNAEDDGEHEKEVFARFGLAMYRAQVLEHGIVNALAVLDLIPSRRHLARSREDWGAEVDAFMDRNFEVTMGRMMHDLREVTQVAPELDILLRDSLGKRNWLAHDFFRERSADFMSFAGRERMIRELDDCGSVFGRADEALEVLCDHFE